MGNSYHHGDLRAALIEAATQTLAGAGIHALNLRTLARELGVSEAAPYHHFRGKEGLVAEVAREGYRALHVRIVEGCEGVVDPYERLRLIGDAYVRHALDHPGYFRAMYGAHIDAMPEAMRPIDTGRPVLLLLVGAAQDVADELGTPERGPAIVRASWSMAHGLATLLLEREIRLDETGIDVESAIAEAFDPLIRGFRAPA